MSRLLDAYLALVRKHNAALKSGDDRGAEYWNARAGGFYEAVGALADDRGVSAGGFIMEADMAIMAEEGERPMCAGILLSRSALEAAQAAGKESK